MAREMNVVPYDPSWPALFAQEKAVLKSILGEMIVDVQHFGSTAIPGMSAKPTIDVMVLVRNIETVDAYNSAMTQAGYFTKGENGIPGRRAFTRLKDDGDNHFSHVHIYEPSNPHVTDELMFRDYLRMNSEAFRQYEAMKLAASARYRFSPKEYTDAKTDCIMEIMAKAKNFYQEEAHARPRFRIHPGSA